MPTKQVLKRTFIIGLVLAGGTVATWRLGVLEQEASIDKTNDLISYETAGKQTDASFAPEAPKDLPNFRAVNQNAQEVTESEIVHIGADVEDLDSYFLTRNADMPPKHLGENIDADDGFTFYLRSVSSENVHLGEDLDIDEYLSRADDTSPIQVGENMGVEEYFANKAQRYASPKSVGENLRLPEDNDDEN